MIEHLDNDAARLLPEGRLMALDIGSKRVGVALSDPLGSIAQPHAVLARYPNLGRALAELVEAYEVVGIVVGRPLTLRGEASHAAEATTRCIEEVRAELEVPIVYWDERLTTRQAERMMIEQGARREVRRQNIDKVAAAILLQSYLDSRLRVDYR